MSKIKEKKGRINRKGIILSVGNRVARYFPYLLCGYVLLLAFSSQSESLNVWIYWPGFHVSMAVAITLSSISPRSREIISIFRNAIYEKRVSSLIKDSVFIFIISAIARVEATPKSFYIKILIFSGAIVYAAFKGITGISAAILAFALFSVLFGWDRRIAGSFALFGLATVPVFLIIERQAQAEQMSIYVYYFLIITILTMIGEHWREGKVMHTEEGFKDK